MTARPDDPQCQELVELVSDYLDHALTLEDRMAFEQHLHTCPPCTTYLAQIKTVLEVAGSLDQARPAGRAEQDLLGLFRRWHDQSPR